MVSIVSVGTAVPPYRMRQDEARQLASEHFRGHIPSIERYLRVFKNALVRERYFCVEPDWFRRSHRLEAKNRLYLEWAERLSVEAIEQCLKGGNIALTEIDQVIFVSSSGIATPSLDVAIINRLGLRADVRRLPLFGLGCAGGAAGLALGGTLAAAVPGATILLIAVELNSLTFQPDDLTKSNLVATSLFGDGAAAVALRGDDAGPVRLLKSASLLRPGTEALMGWDFVDTGFRVLFSESVPDAIAGMIPDAIGDALNGSGITTGDIASFVFHPGGTRILKTYETVLGRPPEDFAASYDVLGRFGNLSSATVLFVLQEQLRRNGNRPGDYGLLAAFGPGFSAEVTLLRWT
jgi:alkylresorcinol/alkylpyrone synthase